jgi:hypothetical protein
MAASRSDSIIEAPNFVVEAGQNRFVVPPTCVCIRRNGVEFRSPSPFPVWTEMTVLLRAPDEPLPIRCTAVVVACDGNRHTGYAVSLLFLNLSRQSEERLRWMAHAVVAA